MTADVVVAGAGIVGAACAAELARAGQRVVVVDPRPVGSGATAAGMGHVLVEDGSEAQYALTELSRRLWLELAASLPGAAEFDLAGTLWVAADEEEMQAVRTKHAYYSGKGVKTAALDSRALYEAEENLRPGLPGGLLIPDDAVVYAPVAAQYLLRNCQVVHAEAVGLEPGEVRLAGGETISCGAAVLATGVWAPGVLPYLPVRPRKGHLAITDRYPGFLRHEVVELGYLKAAHGHATESVACNIAPRPTGQLLVGSCRQFDVSDPAIDPRMLARMLNRAVEYFPGLPALKVIRTWTGFRAATPDGLPLIGPAPDRERVWVATGHEGLGITTSLGTGRLIADSILGRTPPIPAAPYLPNRYGH